MNNIKIQFVNYSPLGAAAILSGDDDTFEEAVNHAFEKIRCIVSPKKSSLEYVEYEDDANYYEETVQLVCHTDSNAFHMWDIISELDRPEFKGAIWLIHLVLDIANDISVSEQEYYPRYAKSIHIMIDMK